MRASVSALFLIRNDNFMTMPLAQMGMNHIYHMPNEVKGWGYGVARPVDLLSIFFPGA